MTWSVSKGRKTPTQQQLLHLKHYKVFLWLSLPGDCRVTDEALLAETT